MSHFIRGYFDGDGSVYFCKELRVNFTGSFSFIKEIESYLKNNKIITTISKTRKKPHQSDSLFAFSSKSDIYNFYNFLYSNANYYLTRKKDKFLMNSMNCWDISKAS
jgi:intein/homing endonuclease